MLYSVEIIEEEAILLAIRPLQIGHRKTTERFLKYEPPVQYVKPTYTSYTHISLYTAVNARGPYYFNTMRKDPMKYLPTRLGSPYIVDHAYS